MGILMGIVSFILGLCINLLDAAVMSFLDLFSFDTDTFYAVFPFAANVKDIFVACGLAVLILGMMWQVFKGFGTPFGIEAENPLGLVMKVGLTWFAVVNANKIMDLFTNLFNIVLTEMKNAPLGGEPELVGFFVGLTNSLIVAVSGITGLIYLIIMLILGGKFLKLLVEAIERYIVYCFIGFVAPLFLSFAAFKSSRNIAETWFRAFFGQSLLIVLNVWSVRMFMSFLEVYNSHVATGMMSPGGRHIPALFIMFSGMAFLNFAMRIDSFLRILGLNTAHTGSSMIQSLGGGAMKLMMAARTVQSMGGKSHASNSSNGSSSTTVNSGSGATGGSGSGASGTAGTAGAAGGIWGAAGGIINRLGGLGISGGIAGAANGSFAKAVRGESSSGGVDTGGAGVDGVAGASGTASGANSTADSSLRGNARTIAAENTLMGLRGKQTNPNTANGKGATNQFASMADKKNLVNSGVNSSRGYQEKYADNNLGNNPTNMGSQLKQDKMTSDAVRAAATTAERDPTTGESVAKFKGEEAAAAMNGVLGFGNEHVANFQYGTNPDDGSSYINGLQYKDGSSVAFESVDGGVANGTYTDAKGNQTGFQLVHDNAVSYNNAQAAAGVPGFNEFDTSKSVGKVGDGSGSSGYYVVPTPPGGTSGGVGVGVNGATAGGGTTAPGSTTTPGASAAATVGTTSGAAGGIGSSVPGAQPGTPSPGASGTGAAAYSPEGTAPPVNGAALKGLLDNSNPVSFKVGTYNESLVERQRSQANTRTPNPRNYHHNHNTRSQEV